MIRRPPRSTLFPTRRSSDLMNMTKGGRYQFRVETASGILPVDVTKNNGLISIIDRKSTRLNSSHLVISYAVFCLKKKKKDYNTTTPENNTYITHTTIHSSSH